jgi:DNA polymerase V
MENRSERAILAIDLKSFYASVECVDRGLDPFSVPLVVCDRTRGQGTIILAVSPYLKKMGIPSRLRLYDLPKIDGMIYAMPRMEHYIKKSVEVLAVYLNYVAPEDMHVYSVDEAFLDVTDYLKAAGMTKVQYARKIIREVYKKTGLTVTAGIGPNLFMAKAAMDIEAKKAKDFLASWEYADVPHKLWPLTPLSEMWGIGERTEARLHELGMYAVGDIAASDPYYLQDKLGVIGKELYEHANGYDEARIQEKYIPDSRSLGVGQTLFKDYSASEALLVLGESLDELLGRLSKEHVLASGLGFWCGYADAGGFVKALRLEQPSDRREILWEALKKIFSLGYDGKSKIRNISLTAFGLEDASYIQPTLFEGEECLGRERSFTATLTDLKERFGASALFRASALLDASTALRRMQQIGGHRK